VTGASRLNTTSTNKTEITGADKGKNDVALLCVNIKKKLLFFLQGEVFFLLTDPLMGDHD